jgi:hypothetical protein
MEEIDKQDGSTSIKSSFFPAPKGQGGLRRQEYRWKDWSEILNIGNVLKPSDLELEMKTFI